MCWNWQVRALMPSLSLGWGLDPQLTFPSLGCNVISTISEYPILCLLTTVQGDLSLLLPFWFSLYFLSWCFRRLWADSYLYLILKIPVENHCRGSSLFQCLAPCFKEPRLFSTDQENHGQIYSVEYHGNGLVTLRIWYCLYMPRVCNGLRESAQTSQMYLSLLLPYASVLMEALLPNGYHLTCLLKTSREK